MALDGNSDGDSKQEQSPPPAVSPEGKQDTSATQCSRGSPDMCKRQLSKSSQAARPASRQRYAALMRSVTYSLRMTPLGRRPEEHVEDYYEIGTKLGEGQFGATFECREKSTGILYACKQVTKSRLVSLGAPVGEVRREVSILHHLAGFPHVVNIKGAYEDSKAVNIVMELCSGGELYDRIVAQGHFSEQRAASIVRTIVQTVEYCHSLGVCHRDLKPENFLFGGPDDDAPLKVIDFGLSLFFKPDVGMEGLAGSPLYMAHEMVSGSFRYGPEIDVWSAGVILYILLCGYPPFGSASQKPIEIFKEIVVCNLDLESFPWPLISAAAKDLIRAMLRVNPKQRLTAHQVLCHPWICKVGVAPDTPLDPAVLSRLRQFSAMNRLKKIATRVIAETLKHEEIEGLREMFNSMDVDDSGTITLEELKVGLKRMGARVTEDEVQRLLESADVDRDNLIDYKEFFAATIHLSRIETDENMMAAFMHFDQDNSGYITKDELATVCRELNMDEEGIDEMIRDSDLDNDGQIDYHEFVAMMRTKKESTTLRSFSFGRNRRDIPELSPVTTAS